MDINCPTCKNKWADCTCPILDENQTCNTDWDDGHLVVVARGVTLFSVRELYVSHEKLRQQLIAAKDVVDEARDHEHPYTGGSCDLCDLIADYDELQGDDHGNP